MSRITIIQLNMGRRRLVAEELRALSFHYVILAIQEPTCRGNSVTGFGITSRVISLSNGVRRLRAAIVVNNPNLDVMELRQYSMADCVACYVKWGTLSFTLVSAYMPDSSDIEEDISVIWTDIRQMDEDIWR